MFILLLAEENYKQRTTFEGLEQAWMSNEKCRKIGESCEALHIM